MKKIYLIAGLCALLGLSSCKKETVTEETTTVNADGTTTTTTTTSTDYDLKLRKAEDRYNDAQRDVEVAKEKGDTKAERIAQDAADKAKAAWEVTKREVREAGIKTEQALEKAGDDVKEGYNKALEDAKAD